MKMYFPLVFCLFFPLTLSAQGWSFFGPDSVNWQNVSQIDGSFRQGRLPRVTIGTFAGVAVHNGINWDYVLKNHSVSVFHSQTYHEAYFSKWNDSTAIVKANTVWEKYPNFHLSTVSNTFAESLWSVIDSIRLCYYADIGILAFPPHDSNTIYAMSLCQFIVSSDNGMSWTGGERSQRFFLPSFFVADNFYDSLLYYGSVTSRNDSFAILKSGDKGFVWDTVITFPWPYSSSSMLARENVLVISRNGLVDSLDKFGIYRSTDFGITWNQTLSSARIINLIRDELQPTHLYAASAKAIYFSDDEGNSWRIYNNTLPSHNLHDLIKDPFSETLYVATDDGIFKVFESVVAAVNSEENILPFSISLEQNFPNPFNSSTNIRFRIPSREFVSITVTDILGREVAILLKEQREAGEYAIHWNADQMPSGVYFCRLTAGSFITTRKVLLMK